MTGAKLSVDEFLTPHQLVARWKNAVTRGTLANWRVRGTGPAFSKVGARVVYRLADVEEYEAKTRAGGNGEAA